MTLAERIIAHASEFTLKKRGENFRKQEKGYWRASTMGLCARQQGYAFVGSAEERRNIGTKSMSLEDGHVHEKEVIERILALPGVKLIADNRPVKVKYPTKNGTVLKIAGTPDLQVSDGGESTVIEVKALQDASFDEVKSTEIPPAKYVAQLKTYLILLKQKFGELYIKNRNNSEVLSFRIELTPEDRKRILKRQLWIQSFIDRKKFPPREYQLGSQECFYCPYSQRCWQGQKFHGYIHKRGAQKGVQVDLSDEDAKHGFIKAVKTFEKTKRQIEGLEPVQSEAKEKIERMMKKFKADGVFADGYTARMIFSETPRPDPTILKKLIESKKIPMIVGSSSYVRINLPKANGQKEKTDGNVPVSN